MVQGKKQPKAHEPISSSQGYMIWIFSSGYYCQFADVESDQKEEDQTDFTVSRKIVFFDRHGIQNSLPYEC